VSNNKKTAKKRKVDLSSQEKLNFSQPVVTTKCQEHFDWFAGQAVQPNFKLFY